MANIGAFHFPLNNLSVPNGIPFFPTITQVGETYNISFNKGYVIDLAPKIPSIVEVEKCEEPEYANQPNSKWYVKVVMRTDFSDKEDKRVIKSAEIARIPDGEGEKLPDTDKIYLVCEVSDNIVQKYVLRENIIWGGGNKKFWVLDDAGTSAQYTFLASRVQENTSK
jgi:hypothetical protein